MSGPIQNRVLRLLQGASHPMSVPEAAQALNMPESSVRVAIRALNSADVVFPANNRRRGQVWMADQSAQPQPDRRGFHLSRGRGFVWKF